MPIRFLDEEQPIQQKSKIRFLDEQPDVRKPYKSILQENLPAPIQAVKEQIAKHIISPTMPLIGAPGVIPQEALPEAQRGLEIGALQGVSAAFPFLPGLPQRALRSIGYEIPQARTPIEQGVSIPLETIGALRGISRFGGLAQKLPLLRNLPATLKSATTLAGYGATKAALEGEPVGPAAVSGAVMGGLGHLGARLGATTFLGPRLGGALGTGGVMAGLGYAQAPEGEKVQEAALQGLIGTGLGLTGKAAPFKKPDKFAGRIVNSLIKPNNKEFLYGKNPGMAIAKEGIVDATFEGLGQKTTKRLSELVNYLNVVMSRPKNITKRFNFETKTESFLDPLHQVHRELSQKPATFSANIERVNKIFSDLSSQKFNNLTPKEALELKRFISDFQDWNKIEGKDRDINIAIRKVYHNIDTAIDSAIPETKQLNERMANLISAKQAIQHRASIVERANLLGLAPRITGAIGGGLTGGIPGGIGGYFAGVAAEKALASPLTKTGAASLLSERYPQIPKETPYRKPLGPGPETVIYPPKKPFDIRMVRNITPEELPAPQERLRLPWPMKAGAKAMTKAEIAQARAQMKKPMPGRFKRQYKREEREKELYRKAIGLKTEGPQDGVIIK